MALKTFEFDSLSLYEKVDSEEYYPRKRLKNRGEKEKIVIVGRRWRGISVRPLR